jgi:hypothetical protein
MSLFRHLATTTGVITVLFAAYQTQRAISEQLHDNGRSPRAVLAGRTGALFVTTLLMGGGAEALIQRVFSQRG